jgi:hypothetical protein
MRLLHSHRRWCTSVLLLLLLRQMLLGLVVRRAVSWLCVLLRRCLLVRRGSDVLYWRCLILHWLLDHHWYPGCNHCRPSSKEPEQTATKKVQVFFVPLVLLIPTFTASVGVQWKCASVECGNSRRVAHPQQMSTGKLPNNADE